MSDERQRRSGRIGARLDRVDGRMKVTGAAEYAAEVSRQDVAHAVIVTSTIGCGRITRMDAVAAEGAIGVLAVLTPFNAPELPGTPRPHDPVKRIPTLLQDALVHYNGQPIALVIADTLERALDAASLVDVHYAEETLELDMATGPRAPDDGAKPSSGEPRTSERGDVDAALAKADVRVDVTYTTPLENHNPMEMHASLAEWEDDELTLHDSTQAVFSVRKTIAKVFSMSPEKVHVISHFTGGGFGSKGGAWSHESLAAMAARHVKRPVRLMLERQQMFGPVGGRPRTEQRLSLGARRDGNFVGLRHVATANTSKIEDWMEPAAVVSRMLYDSETSRTSHELVRLNLGTPTFMRAPGEATGMFALESAVDELAVALGMDPLALRLKNYAETDPNDGKPWSSKGLRECYRIGAERFGWSKRSAEPGSMRDGDTLIGWGMATATRTAKRDESSAKARVLADGSAIACAGTQEIGGGTSTIMSQIAADALGLPVDRVRFELGDTEMPKAPASVGSQTAASTGSAVHEAALAVRRQLVHMAALDPESPLHGAPEDHVRVEDGRMSLVTDPSRGESYAALIARHGGRPVEAQGDAQPGLEEEQYSLHSFGASFVEVRVDPDLGEVRVSRVVGVYDVGRVLNHKTCESQAIGSIVWGIGMALEEETLVDPHTGRYVNADLAEYHVPVNADVGSIDVSFVEPDDPYVNPLGVKGAGEIAMTGLAAAIANAVYHATGRRIRDLPITMDKLL